MIEDLLRDCRYDAASIRAIELPDGTPGSARELLEYIAASI
jgi:hypothetical protein